MKLIFATGNKGKLREAREILGPAYEVLSPSEARLGPEALDVEETGASFAENAGIKAAHLAGLCDAAVFADDSGLEVDALGGAPGIYTARYATVGGCPQEALDIRYRHARASSKNSVQGNPGGSFGAGEEQLPGDANIAKLLRELERVGAVTPEQRRARFKCAVRLIIGGEEASFEGRCEGHIADAPAGDGGFGYDPVFIADAFPGRTLAQVPEDDKNSISHRGEALRKMAEWLKQHK